MADQHPDVAMNGLSNHEVESLRAQHGFNEVKTNQTPEWKKILWRYLDWVSIIILIAAIISATVEVQGGRGWTSFALLIVELNLIVWVGYYSERNAGNAVKELEALTVPMAQAKRDGKWQQVPARELLPGDIIALKGGDVIPADAQLVGEGEPLLVDESSLTGESLPATRKPGDQVLAGATVTQGELDARVTSTGADSFFGKTIALLGAPEERGHLQTVLNQVSIALAVVSFFAVVAIAVVLMVAQDASPGYAVVTAFVIFVSVVPIGMPVVTTTVLAVGAREMAGERAIVTRLSALEELSGMEVLASDKTGTLTLNRLTLDKEDILAWGDSSKDDVLLTASLSAKWDHNDAIDKAVTEAMGGDQQIVSSYKVTKFVPFNPVDKKTVAHVTLPDGTKMVTTKGAPQIIRDLLSDPAAREACDNYIAERGSRGLRSLGVAKSADGTGGWTLTGLISLLDPPRTDSAATIKTAQEMGVEVKMVTGDQLAIAIETSRRLGLGINIMEGKELMGDNEIGRGLVERVDDVDGFAGVYPEHKHRIVEALQRKGRLVGMTGDGVNDAPALKKANVGIAVAGATAAAKGAADIILTEEGISTIITAIRRSRMIFRRLETYIIYRMASSILILGFFFFAIIVLTFEMPTWALVLISLFNDLSVMATSFDMVHSSDMPMVWNMTKDLLVAVGIASVGILGSVLLLYFASLDHLNWWPSGYQLERTGDPGITPGQVVAVMFLALVALIQLNILLTRNPTFFWRFGRKSAPRPSIILLLPMCAFLLAATFIAVYWPANVSPDGGVGNMEGAGWVPILITWAYVIAWWLLADLVKVAIQRLFARYDVIVAQCKETGEPHPGWVRALDAPAEWVNRVGDCLPSPSLAFARTLDARVPGSKALHKSRALRKLLRRPRAPGSASTGAPGSNLPSADPPRANPPPMSLVEAVQSAASSPRNASAGGVLSRKMSAASVLPTRSMQNTLLSRKASAPTVLVGGRGAPAGTREQQIEIVVDRRE